MKKLGITIALVLAIGLLFVGLESETPDQLVVKNTAAANDTSSAKEDQLSSLFSITQPNANPVVGSEEYSIRPAVESEWFSGSLKLQLVDVAQAYEQNIQFPTYSKPLSKDDWSLLNPRAFIPKPLPLAGIDGVQAALVLDHYIVHKDKDLNVQLVISIGETTTNVSSVKLGLGKSDKQLSPIKFEESSGQKVYFFEVEAGALSELNDQELPLKADIVFGGGNEASVSSVVKLVGTDAILTEVGSAYVDGAHLFIPIEFDVNVDGHYRVQANLFDEQTGEPISHVSEKFKLNGLNRDAELKVHAVTLRAKGYSGPYVLSDINVTRAPATPSDKTGYGTSSQESYSIDGFELDRYAEETYENEENKRRLEFLRRMAGHTNP